MSQRVDAKYARHDLSVRIINAEARRLEGATPPTRSSRVTRSVTRASGVALPPVPVAPRAPRTPHPRAPRQPRAPPVNPAVTKALARIQAAARGKAARRRVQQKLVESRIERRSKLLYEPLTDLIAKPPQLRGKLVTHVREWHSALHIVEVGSLWASTTASGEPDNGGDHEKMVSVQMEYMRKDIYRIALERRRTFKLRVFVYDLVFYKDSTTAADEARQCGWTSFTSQPLPLQASQTIRPPRPQSRR
jgi:hypothetical protein